ncbi:MAG: hypothetical protein WDZ59_09855 [Pirellulales bacterium]
MSRRFGLASLLWWSAFVVVLVAAAVAMFWVGEQVQDNYSTPGARARWEDWRQKVREQRGPVERRVPPSEEPPALVLARDYFWVCFTAAMVGLALVWGVTLMLLRAAIAHARKKPAGEEKGAALGKAPNTPGT